MKTPRVFIKTPKEIMKTHRVFAKTLREIIKIARDFTKSPRTEAKFHGVFASTRRWSGTARNAIRTVGDGDKTMPVIYAAVSNGSNICQDRTYSSHCGLQI